MAKIGYARVSTAGQVLDSQVDALEAVGCERVFTDKTSGKLARRPGWDQCLDYLRPNDELHITRLSRMARSVRHLTEVASTLRERQVELVVIHQGIDTRTATGRLLFHLLGAIDEFTADLISEGTTEGLAAARARGRRGGRPRVMTPSMVRLARELIDDGKNPGQIAGELRVSRTSIYRYLGEEFASPTRRPAV